MLASSKLIWGGLATIGLMGVGIGIGIVFGSMVIAFLSRNPTLEGMLFRYVIRVFSLTEAMALFLWIGGTLFYLCNIFGGSVFGFLDVYGDMIDICVFLCNFSEWKVTETMIYRSNHLQSIFQLETSYKDNRTGEVQEGWIWLDTIIFDYDWMGKDDRIEFFSTVLQYLKDYKRKEDYKTTATQREKASINRHIKIVRSELRALKVRSRV